MFFMFFMALAMIAFGAFVAGYDFAQRRAIKRLNNLREVLPIDFITNVIIKGKKSNDNG
jgi:hypothetical protein